MLKWITPKIAGKPPEPRYGHTMNYYPDKSILVIFGGRNDSNLDKYGYSYMNDVWLLFLEKLTWCKWETKYTLTPIKRHSHCAEITGNMLILFGGLSEENYCNGDVYALDLDGSKRVAIEDEKSCEEKIEEKNEKKVNIKSWLIRRKLKEKQNVRNLKRMASISSMSD